MTADVAEVLGRKPLGTRLLKDATGAPWPEMRDAAFPNNIQSGWMGAVGGYVGGPLAFNTWSPPAWRGFPRNRKLPIWVAGHAPKEEAANCLAALEAAGVPTGVRIAVDLETRVDNYWLETFDVIVGAKYLVMVYGSASTVFGNLPLRGYWVADYANIGPFMYDHPEVRATQYAPGAREDASTVHRWVLDTLWL